MQRDETARPGWEVTEIYSDHGVLGSIAFVSLRDNLDLGTPSGRLMFQIIGAMAEFERALIQQGGLPGSENPAETGPAT